MVYKKNVENTLDSKKIKHRSDGDGRYLQETGHYDKAETTGVPRPCIDRAKLGKGLPTWHGGRYKSAGKAKTEIYGWYQDSARMQQHRRSYQIGSK